MSPALFVSRIEVGWVKVGDAVAKPSFALVTVKVDSTCTVSLEPPITKPLSIAVVLPITAAILNSSLSVDQAVSSSSWIIPLSATFSFNPFWVRVANTWPPLGIPIKDLSVEALKSLNVSAPLPSVPVLILKWTSLPLSALIIRPPTVTYIWPWVSAVPPNRAVPSGFFSPSGLVGIAVVSFVNLETAIPVPDFDFVTSRILENVTGVISWEPWVQSRGVLPLAVNFKPVSPTLMDETPSVGVPAFEKLSPLSKSNIL